MARGKGGSRERICAPRVAPDHRQVGPQHWAPARRREPPVGEQQDREPEQDDGRRPGIFQQQGDRAKRQAVAQTVSQQRIGRGIRREQLEASGGGEQDPADRVAGLPADDDEAHCREEHGHSDVLTAVHLPVLVRQGVKRH